MSVSYERLWKLLADKKISPSELRKKANFAPNTLTRLRKDEFVTMDVLNKICNVLDSDFGEIMEHEKDIQEKL